MWFWYLGIELYFSQNEEVEILFFFYFLSFMSSGIVSTTGIGNL